MAIAEKQKPDPLSLPAAIPPPYGERRRSHWKWFGYRAAAQYMASDNDLFVLRRFSELNTRVLLAKQAEIHNLERILDELDKPREGEEDVDNSTVLRDQRVNRPQVIHTLWTLLKEYNDFIISHSELRARPSASKFELKNLADWRETWEGTICLDEVTAFDQVEDLIPIVVKPRTLLRSLLEKCGGLITSIPFRRMLKSQFQDEPDEDIKYFDDKKVDRTVYVTVVVVGLGMLLGPIWWLYKDTNQAHRLAIISGFIVLFSLLLGLTHAKPHEAMAATAGYSAVLMIYMQLPSS